MHVHLLVCYLDTLQNARCNVKDYKSPVLHTEFIGVITYIIIPNKL